MELKVWHGDWGLPSIDHHCLAVMAYCKFSEAPVTLTKCGNPWKSPSGELPVLKHDKALMTKVNEIFNYLRQNRWGLDHELTTKQCADIVAFTALIEDKLVPALLYLWWVDSKTYLELTRPWFSSRLPFPLNFYLPLKKHKDYVNYLNQAYNADNLTETEREQKVYKDAKECLNILSSKLGNKDYFFGNSPSSLDAVVFGYLAPLLKAPFPNTVLQTHLKSCHDLTRYCERILSKYFPLTPEEETELRKSEEERRHQQTDISEFPNKRRNMMIAGAVALTAMMGYAFLSGLIEIKIVDEDKNENGTNLSRSYDAFHDVLGDDDDDDGSNPGSKQDGQEGNE
ncbi:hypothetical protein LSH36_19g05007 [Paralvinella palmiformis]|uniref:Metaxin n=1 Tax=Paralvinella palmiformis TaxID=53620 RepID=A0AAD9KBS0_9ANNE|nr:hypothetical protein LSH36_19g05007 [Paralvinella palmiformis]